MSKFKTILLAAVVLALVSCGTSKLGTSYKTEAQKLSASADYVQATRAWEQYFSKIPLEQVKGEDLASAALCAFKAGNMEQAKSWFDQARYKDFASAEMYLSLAEIYQKEDNLSKELSALEVYREKFGNDSADVNERLFQIYAEINEYNKALQAWQNMDDETKNNEQTLNHFFVVNKKLENKGVCDSVSLVLLEKNPENIEALDWNARKYYWAGQNRYDREMAKYSKMKTRKNYNILLKELDLVTADFKKALPYLNKLWELEPGKEYAGYLANIYARFGDQKKVNYYKKYMK